ncbi:MAG: hypothetical protein JST68_20395 [Bacteroidetes bacterium]|nr:hypothetical protein [Bacteroidota bacterium]
MSTFASMRLYAFILNLLMLMMILAPCRDHASQGVGKTNIQRLHSATPNSGLADDDCSPLCTCSCCASVSPVIYVPIVEGVASPVASKKFPIYIAPDYAAERSAVWQPPRIG